MFEKNQKTEYTVKTKIIIIKDKYMNCQICNGIITPFKTNDIEILKCDTCGGFWLHKGDLNKLVKHQAGDLEFSSVDHHIHKDKHGILKCVFCEDQAMIKINFIENSNIVLDYCENCGALWVDGGELGKMEEYIGKIEKDGKKKSIREIIMEIIYSLPQI